MTRDRTTRDIIIDTLRAAIGAVRAPTQGDYVLVDHEKDHTMTVDQPTLTFPEHEPHARNADPGTSHAAAETAAKSSTIQRQRVWGIIADNPDGMSLDDVVAVYNARSRVHGWGDEGASSGPRTRLHELYEDGWVRREEAKPYTGRSARGNTAMRHWPVFDPAERERRRDEVAERKRQAAAERNARGEPMALAPTTAETATPEELRERLAGHIRDARVAGQLSSQALARALVDSGWHL